MRVMMSAMALMLATGAVAQPAFAQAKPEAAAAEPDTTCQKKLSPKFTPVIVEAMSAGNAKDWATMRVKLDAANKLAKTSDDKCLAARFDLMYASNNDDMPGALAALKVALANGLPSAMGVEQLQAVGVQAYNKKDYATASVAFVEALKLDPASENAIWLAETRAKQGQAAEAVADMKKAIALKAAKGQVPDTWYSRAADLAFNANNPLAHEIARQWVMAYPTKENWRNAIVIGTALLELTDEARLDLYRLDRAVGSLNARDNLGAYADILQLNGFAAEADAVLTKAFADGVITSNVAAFKEVHQVAKQKMQGERGEMGGNAAKAVAAKNPKTTLKIAESYLGYDDYAKSAELSRAALAMPGVNADRANLRLGIALALAGDKAGATAALSEAKGNWGEIAKYWLAYLATRS